MTEDLVNTTIFYFICATLGAFFTILVLFLHAGIEGNPVWSWIQPNELLAISIVTANLILGLFILYLVIPYVSKRHWIYPTLLKCGLIGEGFGRVLFGVVPGILLLKGAGWF